MNSSDTELLIRSRTDPEAIGELYSRHAAAIHAYLARRVERSAADDLLADIFVAAVQSRRRARPHASGSALLSSSPASPQIRQTIWKELAKLTGVKTSGKRTDAIGRTGWVLTYQAHGHGSQGFLVDPASGAILQGETKISGTTYRVTYLEAGPAATAPTPAPERRMPTETANPGATEPRLIE